MVFLQSLGSPLCSVRELNRRLRSPLLLRSTRLTPSASLPMAHLLSGPPLVFAPSLLISYPMPGYSPMHTHPNPRPRIPTWTVISHGMYRNPIGQARGLCGIPTSNRGINPMTRHHGLRHKPVPSPTPECPPLK